MNTYYYANRKYVIGMFFILFAVIYLIKLFYLQVIDTTTKIIADSNVFRYVTQYPARGLIFDRNGNLLVFNEATYDLMIIPTEVRSFDTTDLCEILEIPEKTLKASINKAKEYSRVKPSQVVKQLPTRKYALIQEKLIKFPGFFLQTRTRRKYPKPIAAHLLGYVGEVTENIINRKPYYKPGDYFGVSGIESTYEEILRGKKGMNIYMVDVHNNIKGSYKDGLYDTVAVVGSNITTTIDSDLQEYGEQLMQNKVGSIVAIEPSTGEILAMVSSPTYNPNLLVGNDRTDNYDQLSRNPLKPLFNRALMAAYPPGSTFKLVNALISLQDGLITENSIFTCNYGFDLGDRTIKCHHPGALDLGSAIQGSCNSYFCFVFDRILDNKKYLSVDSSYRIWRRHVQDFGLGLKIESDLSNELAGIFYSADFYNKKFKKRWNAYRIMSMAIGQGDLGFTPLQMCNMTAAIANRGFFYKPHILKEINGQKKSDERFTDKNVIPIEPRYFEIVIDAMERVVTRGTANDIYYQSLSICGKTGTAQNPHGPDHSIFVAFSPRVNPKIAIAVYVENAGAGSTFAAPIASLMIEKYLKKTISRIDLENQIVNTYILPTDYRR